MASRVALRQVLRCCNARSFSSTSHARAVSEFAMPSMYAQTLSQPPYLCEETIPLMRNMPCSVGPAQVSHYGERKDLVLEGVKEGDKFSAGDVLLTVETDKAEVDVEAQDDGVVGKILYDEKESSIQVGKIIALMAEEGDDISNLSAPSESSPSSSSASSSSSSSKEAESTSSSGKDSIEKVEEAKSSSHTTSSPSTATAPQQADQHEAPKHSRPLLPSVHMLLLRNGSPDVSGVKGTGVRGQLTKGDILTFLGKIDNPVASASKLVEVSEKMDKPKDANKEKFGKGAKSGAGAKAAAPQKIMSGQELRRWIAAGLAKPAARVNAPVSALGFDDILDGYLPKPTYNQQRAVPPTSLPGQKDPWDELLGL